MLLRRYLTLVLLPERLRTVLSQKEVTRLLEAAPGHCARQHRRISATDLYPLRPSPSTRLRGSQRWSVAPKRLQADRPTLARSHRCRHRQENRHEGPSEDFPSHLRINALGHGLFLFVPNLARFNCEAMAVNAKMPGSQMIPAAEGLASPAHLPPVLH